MRGRSTTIAVALALIVAAGSGLARVARPPARVGPPAYPVSSACTPTITATGGRSAGVAIPFAGLALGAPVTRNETSFPTGGSGTANFLLAAQRKQAGLQYEPKAFDPAARELPSVFAADASQASGPQIYQRLLLKPSKVTALPYGLIFARATSAKAGRIVSLELTLAAKPSSVPTITIARARPGFSDCPSFEKIHVYAADMPADQLVRLSTSPNCGWLARGACALLERPRGRVLFIQQQRGGIGYDYRWVDYDLLLAGEGSPATKSSGRNRP